MARRNQNPRKAAMRKMMGEFLKETNISLKNGADVNSLMHEMMSALIIYAGSGIQNYNFGVRMTKSSNIYFTEAEIYN